MISTDNNTPLTLITATTGAENSVPFRSFDDQKAVVFSDTAILSTEVIKLQVMRPDGNWIDCYAEGEMIRLKGNQNIYALWGKGIYRVVKASTASAVGIYVYNASFRG